MRHCPKCKTEKLETEFYKEAKRKDGIRIYCIPCCGISNKSYIRSKAGLITKIYCAQKANSKVRGHSAPEYTKTQLSYWLFNQPKFHYLFDMWVSSGYDRNLAPSCDRSDDYLGYSLDRLQLVTWKQNNDKGRADRKNGIDNRQNKSVLQFSKDGNFIKEHHSTREASRQTGADNSHIARVCKGEHKYKTAGGFIWKYKNQGDT